MTEAEIRRTAQDLREAFGSSRRAAEQAERHLSQYPEGHLLRSYWARVRDELARTAKTEEDDDGR